MKYKILIAALFISSLASAQGVVLKPKFSVVGFWNVEWAPAIPPGYTYVASRYQWIAGYYTDGLTLPGYNGTPTNKTGVATMSGNVAVDTLNHLFYFRSGGTWRTITGGSGGGISEVIAGYGLTNVNDSTLKVDSATLSATYLRRKDSLTTSNSLGYVTKKILSDSAAAIRAAGGTGTSLLSARVFYTSKWGCISDASLAMATTTFGTNNTTRLQAILDSAQNGPIEVVIDGKYSCTGLRIRPNTLIRILPYCGLILRDNSDVELLQNYNLTYNAIGDSNITIIGNEGSILNCNGFNTSNPSGAQAKEDADGFNFGFRFAGVKNISISGVNVYAGRTFGITFTYCENILVEKVNYDAGPYAVINCDGIDFIGYIKHARMLHCTVYAYDDHVGIASDASQPFNPVLLPGIVSDFLIDDITLLGGLFGIRLFSGATLMTDITVRHVRGTCENYWLIVDNFWQDPSVVVDSGPGNFGTLLFEDIDVIVTADPYVAVNDCYANIAGNVKSFTIKDYVRNNFALDAFPSLLISNGCTVGELNVDGYRSLEDVSLSAKTTYHFDINDATVNRVNIINAKVVRDYASNTSSLLVIQEGATVGRVMLNNIECKNMNNIVAAGGSSLNYISASNIVHEGAPDDQGTFRLEDDVSDVVLSNYFGYLQTSGSGTIGRMRGDGFTGSLPDLAAADLLTGLEASWKLDESSGNAADASGNSHTFTNNGTVSYVSGKINNASSFSGTNFLSSNYTLNAPSFSVSFWINISAFSGVQQVVTSQKSSTGNFGFSLYLNEPAVSQKLILGWGDASGGITSTTINQTLSTSTWYMVTVTVSGAHTIVYINNTKITDVTQTSNVFQDSNTKFYAGCDVDQIAGAFFTGKLDNINVYSKVLTATDIAALWNSGAGLQHPF